MKVLLQNSHHQSGRPDGWSGAPGEALWVMDLNDRIESFGKAVGISISRVDGDLQDHPGYKIDYDLFDAPHYEANVHYTIGSYLGPTKRCGLIPEALMLRNRVGRPLGFSTDAAGHVGGWLWGRASTSLTAPLDDKIGGIFQQGYVALQQRHGYDLPFRNNWNNVNITDYYGFRLTSAKTAGWLTEHGVGAPGAPDADWLRAYIDEIANIHVASYLLFSGQTPNMMDYHIFGPSSVLPGTLLAFARKVNPNFEPEWVAEYYAQAPQASMRVEFVFAQMLKESNYGRFTGVAQPDWNNPVGLGVIGPTGVGNRFPTKHDGVRAHLQHLLWYLYPEKHTNTPFCTPLVDQRHAGEHKMLGNDVRLLNGKWAVPGPTYGNDIAKIANDIRIFGGIDVPDLTLVQKMIDDSIGSYGQRLESGELVPMKNDIASLQAGPAGAVPAHEHHTLSGTVVIK